MKAKLIFGLALIASFVLVSNLHSSGRSYKPDGYCAYNYKTGFCEKQSSGDACYMVFADCTYIE